MLSNMAGSLIENKRITTTVAKAKALRKYIEPLLTKAKSDTTHSRRVVFSYLQDKFAVQTLFDEVAAKIADRPGGYTRIIKLSQNRVGDNAEMAMIELVDFNELLLQDAKPEKTKTRRSRRGGKKQTEEKAAVESPVVEEAEVVEDAVVEETKVDSKPEETVEEKTEEIEDPKAENENSEENDEDVNPDEEKKD